MTEKDRQVADTERNTGLSVGREIINRLKVFENVALNVYKLDNPTERTSKPDGTTPTNPYFTTIGTVKEGQPPMFRMVKAVYKNDEYLIVSIDDTQLPTFGFGGRILKGLIYKSSEHQTQVNVNRATYHLIFGDDDVETIIKVKTNAHHRLGGMSFAAALNQTVLSIQGPQLGSRSTETETDEGPPDIHFETETEKLRLVRLLRSAKYVPTFFDNATVTALGFNPPESVTLSESGEALQAMIQGVQSFINHEANLKLENVKGLNIYGGKAGEFIDIGTLTIHRPKSSVTDKEVVTCADTVEYSPNEIGVQFPGAYITDFRVNPEGQSSHPSLEFISQDRATEAGKKEKYYVTGTIESVIKDQTGRFKRSWLAVCKGPDDRLVCVGEMDEDIQNEAYWQGYLSSEFGRLFKGKGMKELRPDQIHRILCEVEEDHRETHYEVLNVTGNFLERTRNLVD